MSGDLLLIPEPRHISNSEVSAWLACQRKWYYAHSMNIAPKKYSVALNRGIIGHEILAAYYNVLMEQGINDASRRNAEEVAQQVWMRYYTVADDSKDMLYSLWDLLTDYFKWCPEQEQGWKILEVEQKFAVPLTDEYDYTMRLDVLVQDMTGEKIVVDHKFVYDFWNATGFDMNPQAPKYIAALKVNDYPVQRAMLNMIRHRTKKGPMLPEEKFRREFVKPMSVEIRNVMREQILASRQIIEMRGLPRQAQAERVLRNMGPYTCKTCSFVEPCKAELQGGSIDVMLATYFRQNDYDYNTKDDSGDSIL